MSKRPLAKKGYSEWQGPDLRSDGGPGWLRHATDWLTELDSEDWRGLGMFQWREVKGCQQRRRIVQSVGVRTKEDDRRSGFFFKRKGLFSKCWNTCTLHNKIVGHLSAVIIAFDCFWCLLLQLLVVLYAPLSLISICMICVFLCVFVYAFMYFLCVHGPSAWNKTDDDDDDETMHTREIHTLWRCSDSCTRRLV